MNDLVTRLRSPDATVIIEWAPGSWSPGGALLREAANEIERLTAERNQAKAIVVELGGQVGEVQLRVNRLTAERDELRADTERSHAAIRLQAAAVRTLDRKERGEYLATQSLDSERAMNATLTAEVERLTAERDAARGQADIWATQRASYLDDIRAGERALDEARESLAIFIQSVSTPDECVQRAEAERDALRPTRELFVRAVLPLLREIGTDEKWAGPLADAILRALAADFKPRTS